jgi:hypothetical protein
LPRVAECKALFTKCHSLPSAALGKEAVCRVSVKRHSAKHLTLGIEAVSDSARPNSLLCILTFF